ncbi:Glucans biosynthesis glucosyltransferase H [Roseivivax jejudonensis]|uniref:Glucans biosynthesis glucosyltransferase H n=1 Tax=Roseivivax jejudonensis TaxID=1529041 RepID=A0A1X6YN37_9RHOB|nr:glucans biosynthesis glucosyltransferase MdoH [Roseivivax jejudonensis]SLN24373.1 Glucans biosynthesis glucosyltransferase H [Roseivivax jejudonensis]
MTAHIPQSRFAPAEVVTRPQPGTAPTDRRPLWTVIALTAALTGLIMAGYVLTIGTWTVWAVVAMALITLTTLTLSLGAATAVVGLIFPAPRAPRPMPDWQPSSRTAILLTLCGEPPRGPAAMLAELAADLQRAGLDRFVDIFVISDTRDDKAKAEAEALAPLIGSGAITYRRRQENVGRKPGNISDWLDRWGGDYDFMLPLDADSRMSARRIRHLIHRMERSPSTGLLQSGMRLLPAETRFGQLQRSAQRIMGPTFLQGFSAWTGDAGNYWGHNALIRVRAFRDAVPLPKLSGVAPFGGDVLSHDFVEAAWMRRAGWRIEIDADTRASAEDGPQTLAEYHKRDRRWCQGNLQHLRLIAAPGLHPLSRLHMAVGVMGYLSAPLWLATLLLLATGAVPMAAGWMLLAVATLLAAPKLCGVARLMRQARGLRTKGVVLRAAALETVLSSILAPIVMVNHVVDVAQVFAGRDCGWKRPGGASLRLPTGGLEALAGTGIIALVAATNPSAVVWVLPVALPLVFAPLFIRFMEAPCACLMARA